MSKKEICILIFLFGVFISSCSQILLKKSANMEHKKRVGEYLNLRVIIAYMLFFTATIFSTIAYRFVPLSFGPVLEATGYLYVTGLSVIILKEKISMRKIKGIAIIVIGIIIYSIS